MNFNIPIPMDWLAEYCRANGLIHPLRGKIQSQLHQSVRFDRPPVIGRRGSSPVRPLPWYAPVRP